VNLDSGKLSRVKSHDYHIFMGRLLPIIFCRYLNDDVGKALAELSHFYRHLYAKEIKKEMMEKLEKEILVLICKLEKIFPTGWFNPMQYLLVHFSYEAKVGGPQQYRWMYHIERAVKNIRVMVHNKARVEDCITEEFKLKEITYFTSVYFTEHHNVNAPTMWYHVMKTFLVVTFKFSNEREWLLVPPCHTCQLRKSICPLCSTCTQIWMRWINILRKSILFSSLMYSW
jgi:hypothetical protein